MEIRTDDEARLPAPPGDLRGARLRLMGLDLVHRAHARAYAGGIVGLVLDGEEVLLTLEAAEELAGHWHAMQRDPSRSPLDGERSSLNWAIHLSNRAIERARGAHLFQVFRRGGRLAVKHADREGWLEPTIVRKPRRCASCDGPQPAGATMYREVERQRAPGIWIDLNDYATDPRHTRLCSECVEKAAEEPRGELVALPGGRDAGSAG